MSDRIPRSGSSLLDRAARVAFTLLLMNYAAVAGLIALLLRRKVWR